MLLALCNMNLVIFGGIIAYAEGKWSHKSMGLKSIPFKNHGGMWADFFLLTPVAYLIAPFVLSWTGTQIAISLAISSVISIIAHIAWTKLQPIPGHIIDPQAKGWRKLTLLGGWYHMAYMTVALAMIMMFYLCSPGAPRFWVSVFLSILIPVGSVGVGYYIDKVLGKGFKIDKVGWTLSIVMWIVIWTIGYPQP